MTDTAAGAHLEMKISQQQNVLEKAAARITSVCKATVRIRISSA